MILLKNREKLEYLSFDLKRCDWRWFPVAEGKELAEKRKSIAFDLMFRVSLEQYHLDSYMRQWFYQFGKDAFNMLKFMGKRRLLAFNIFR